MTISRIHQWWESHQTVLLRIAIAIMSLLAVIRLVYEFHRLVIAPDGAVDLKLRYDEIQMWFDGLPVYHLKKSAVYPPASYMMLWPLLKPFTWIESRWLWALILPAMTGWFTYLIVKESGVTTGVSKISLTLFVAACYPTAVCIGNGQLPLLIIPPLLTAIILLRRHSKGWKRDLFISLLLLFSLLKPSISVPFFGFLFISGSAIRILSTVTISYGVLTLWSLSFQMKTATETVQQLLQNASVAAVGGGYGDIHSGFTVLGLENWTSPFTLAILLSFGLWLIYHRHCDMWLLLGVAAIVARIWTYHRLYDDMLIFVPMVALIKIAQTKHKEPKTALLGGLLLLCSFLAFLAPGTLLRLPFPYGTPFRTGQTILWITIALFLCYQARQQRTRMRRGHSLEGTV